MKNERNDRRELIAEIARLRTQRNKLLEVIRNARVSLAAFGGDLTRFPKSEAECIGADMIQWTLLTSIDDAIKSCL